MFRCSLTLVCCLIASTASALPVWPEPPGCGCDWIETVQPPDDTPDLVQTAEERIADLFHEPPPEFTLVCVSPPSEQPPSGPPISTPEPATWLLLVAAVVLIPLKVRR